jgi:hypothetical protein
MYFGQGSASQTTINTYETSKDKYSHAAGHDARGWAWGLYHYSPGAGSSYAFNDYKWSSQASANWRMVWGIRATARPVGAIVEASTHAVDLIGYQTLNDPFTVSQQTLYGFYILDPWYGNGDSGMPHWPYNGFSPNAYQTIANWNAFDFTAYADGSEPYWNGTYVAVLQASVLLSPRDNPAISYGEAVYNSKVGAASTDVTATAGYAVDVARPDIEQAVASGLMQNDLVGPDSRLGIDLRGYTIGQVAHVAPLDGSVPPYDLVELAVGGTVRAVAMVDESAAGYRFGALRGYSGGPYPLASAVGRDALATWFGMKSGATLGWAPSAESPSPFDPFLVGSASSSGASLLISSAGRFTAIHLASATAVAP